MKKFNFLFVVGQMALVRFFWMMVFGVFGLILAFIVVGFLMGAMGGAICSCSA